MRFVCISDTHNKHWEIKYPFPEGDVLLVAGDITKDTDILLTHGPPYQILDQTREGKFAGSKTLKDKISNSNIKYHIFGHIHEEGSSSIELGCTTFINASICTRNYKPINKPIIFDYVKEI